LHKLGSPTVVDESCAARVYLEESRRVKRCK
jgi:hypothetical protein